MTSEAEASALRMVVRDEAEKSRNNWADLFKAVVRAANTRGDAPGCLVMSFGTEINGEKYDLWLATYLGDRIGLPQLLIIDLGDGNNVTQRSLAIATWDNKGEPQIQNFESRALREEEAFYMDDIITDLTTVLNSSSNTNGNGRLN